MDNISKVFSTIMENPKLQQELAKKETIEEAYDYCISISGGYTIEEFKESLQELVKMVNSMPEEQLEKISGGIKLNNRVLSTMLATISLASPLAGAAGSTKGTTSQNPPSKTSSSVEKIKKIISKNLIASVTNSAAAGTGIGLLLAKLFGDHRIKAIAAERDTFKNNLATAQNNLATAQNNLATAQNDLATAQNDLATAQNERDTALSNLTAAQEQYDANEALLQEMQRLYPAPPPLPSADNMPKYFEGVDMSKVKYGRFAVKGFERIDNKKTPDWTPDQITNMCCSTVSSTATGGLVDTKLFNLEQTLKKAIHCVAPLFNTAEVDSIWIGRLNNNEHFDYQQRKLIRGHDKQKLLNLIGYATRDPNNFNNLRVYVKRSGQSFETELEVGNLTKTLIIRYVQLSYLRYSNKF